MSFRKIWNAITTVLTVIVVLGAVGLVAAKLLGVGMYTVLSGSMEPTYHVGSVIFVAPAKAGEIEVGDPITFQTSGGTTVTHRVVEIVDGAYRTKGDANDAEDGSLVPANRVIGKPMFSIPFVGYVADYFSNPPGIYIGVVIIAVLVFSMFIPDKKEFGAE